jgi:hypothetical protein
VSPGNLWQIWLKLCWTNIMTYKNKMWICLKCKMTIPIHLEIYWHQSNNACSCVRSWSCGPGANCGGPPLTLLDAFFGESFEEVVTLHNICFVRVYITFHVCHHQLVQASDEDNPTVMVIQQCSKQSFQPHHPGVSETPPSRFFFLNKFIGKMLNFSVKKSDYSLTSWPEFTQKLLFGHQQKLF